MAGSSNPVPGAARRIPFVAALVLAVASLAPAQRADPVGLAGLQREFVELVEKLTPAVVRVGAKHTGVIVDGRGYVLSDAAAVPEQMDAAQLVRVELASGRVYDARAVSRSARSRTALLKIVKGTRFASIPAGDSDELRVGAFVLTIGNAFNQASQGGQPAVTVGHVAGLWTAGADERIKVGRIVTTAALNPGTSGGPLIDVRGSLIGINDQQRGPGDMGQVMPINFIRESYAECEEAYRVLSLGAHKRASPRRYAGYMDQTFTEIARQVSGAVVALRIVREPASAPPAGGRATEDAGQPEAHPEPDPGDQKPGNPEAPDEERLPASRREKSGKGVPQDEDRREREGPRAPGGEGESPPKTEQPGESRPAKPQDAPAPAHPLPPPQERKDSLMPVDRGPVDPAPSRPAPARDKRPVFRLKPRTDPVSAVIVDSEGLILTATSNLWESATQKIKQIDVLLPDQRVMPAERLGTDHVRGVTVLRIPASGLPVLPEANPDEVRVGSFVAVIGNPYGERRVGIESFLTWGVLSARNQINPAVDALQTDAWVNQANQGGALVDAQGRLLGIAMLYNPARYGLNSGIGFVVPIWSVRRTLARVTQSEDLWPGYLGVRLPPVFEPEIRGARVVKVVKHSPADRGGLQPGDCILRINGTSTPDNLTALEQLRGAIAGEPLDVEVARDGRISTLRITADRRS